ncbi:MAG: hypothetical protein C0610_02650 [Desulfobacteraceae bacterium]|nr:MAG: hypothetical protein C0610_02650 [Desulfobacteraceae bacterium]
MAGGATTAENEGIVEYCQEKIANENSKTALVPAKCEVICFLRSMRPSWVENGGITQLTLIFHELPTATADMSVLPGVLGYRALRRTVQVRLGSNPLRLPGGTPFSTVSRQQFVKYQG